MVTIKVYSDYVCPYCFLGEKVLTEATAGLAVAIEWMPFELRPAPTPTLHPEGSYLQGIWRDSVYPLAEALGIPIVLPDVSPQPHTHLAFEGYQFAKDYGLGREYNHRMFTAFFQEAQDIGQAKILAELAAEIGLDPDLFLQALVSRRYEPRHRAALRSAAQLGIWAVPSFIIGNKLVRGLPQAADLARLISEEVIS